MILDIILIGAVIVWAVYGYRKGFIRQAFALGGILVVMFASAPVAEVMQNILTNEFNIAIAHRYIQIGLLFASACILYILVHLIGCFIYNTFIKDISFAESTNHVLGSVLGIIASTLSIYFILCLFAFGQNKVEEYTPAVQKFLNASTAYRIADHNNVILQFDFANALNLPELNELNQTIKPSQSEEKTSK